jgi:hypothetical protein
LCRAWFGSKKAEHRQFFHHEDERPFRHGIDSFLGFDGFIVNLFHKACLIFLVEVSEVFAVFFFSLLIEGSKSGCKSILVFF